MVLLSPKALAVLDPAWIEDTRLQERIGLLKEQASRNSHPELAGKALTELSAVLTNLGWRHTGEVNHFSTGFIHPTGLELPTAYALAYWATNKGGFEEVYMHYQRSDGLTPHQAFLRDPMSPSDLYLFC